MNELNLYGIFQTVLQRSKVMEGRFFVATGYGNDLNTNNFGEIIKDAVGGITTEKKYPLAVMLPPYEYMQDASKGWSNFKIRMLFLVPQYSNNGLKSPNEFNNTSEHTVVQDWKDMRECAGDFRKFLEEVLTAKNLLNQIRISDHSMDAYDRFSNIGNDKLSAVMLSFNIELFNSCDLKDYDLKDIDKMGLVLIDTHPLHTQ